MHLHHLAENGAQLAVCGSPSSQPWADPLQELRSAPEPPGSPCGGSPVPHLSAPIGSDQCPVAQTGDYVAFKRNMNTHVHTVCLVCSCIEDEGVLIS